MASDRSIEANRANAQLSTGPRTPEGKAVSRHNALKHGITAKGLLPDESAEEFGHFCEALFDELSPQGALEDEITRRIASLMWRLRRIPAFEAALLTWIETCKQVEERPQLPLPGDRCLDGHSLGPPPARLILGRTIERFLQSDVSGKLSRYETSLQKQLAATLKELRILQARRQAPTAGDSTSGRAVN